ncbi:hypothetical protein L208DRAFT_1141420, partial [Tricholoma matsutake]
LAENNLYLKPEKCKFNVHEVELLGLIIRPNRMLKSEVAFSIQDWPTPTNVKAVRSFLGFGNFY